ncbi:MAG: Gx transporter family protein [Fusobacteriaceae bacterium]
MDKKNELNKEKNVVKKGFKGKEELFLTAFVLLSVYLSLGESIIPKPFPWMKLGLANIATIIALEKFGSKMALEVVLLRVFIQGLMLGTLFTPSFIISLSAGLVSTLSMIFLYRFRDYLSLISISIVSGFLHNLLQLIVVYFLIFRNMGLNSKSIMLFIWIFLGLGVLSGAITGVIAEKSKIRREV